jgi:hypothetical protein
MCVPCDISLFPIDIILHEESSIQAIDVGSIPICIHVEGKSLSMALQDVMQIATITPAAKLVHMHITALDEGNNNSLDMALITPCPHLQFTNFCHL